jgi:solute carrier family 25 carnitine/acylcarnitine transporter 20/29
MADLTGWGEAIATLKDLTAGTVGGCAGIVAGQPLDTIKVRMQTQDKANVLFRGPVVLACVCFRFASGLFYQNRETRGTSGLV